MPPPTVPRRKQSSLTRHIYVHQHAKNLRYTLKECSRIQCYLIVLVSAENIAALGACRRGLRAVLSVKLKALRGMREPTFEVFEKGSYNLSQVRNAGTGVLRCVIKANIMVFPGMF